MFNRHNIAINSGGGIKISIPSEIEIIYGGQVRSPQQVSIRNAYGDHTVEAESDQDNSVLFASGSNWSTTNSSKYSNGYARKNLNTNTTDLMRITSLGRNVKIYGTKGPNKGKFAVWIFRAPDQIIFTQDAGFFHTLDAYGAQEQNQVLLFDLEEELGVSPFQGTLDEIQVLIYSLNDKNTNSSGDEFIIDYLLFESDRVKSSSYITNPIRAKTSTIEATQDGGETEYAVGTTTISVDTMDYKTGFLLLEVVGLSGDNPTVDITLRQGIEVGEDSVRVIDYTPEDGVRPVCCSRYAGARN